VQPRHEALLHFYFDPPGVAQTRTNKQGGADQNCLGTNATDKQAPTSREFSRKAEQAMTGKSKRVKLQIEDPATGKVRTLEFTVTILDSDCPRTNPHKQRVIILRRRLRWKRLPKVRVKII
jgi:hypothetical protein